MVLLRRKLRCHYCNTQSRDNVSHIPRTYRCPVCDAVNYFDEQGNITDPPVEEISTAATASYQYIQSRSPSPAMRAPADDLFCTVCQRNQSLMTNLLAEYLPDEEDPEYEKYEASYDDYKAELGERYPQVCRNCEPRVQQQIRQSAYTAKADHLRRVMEKSQQRRSAVQTSRQVWTLRIIALGKWTYILSTLVGIIWHSIALIMAPNEETWTEDTFRWDICWQQAVSVFSIDESCVLSPSIVRIQQCAILADLLTLWWNPKLRFKTNSLTGQMSGLKSLWTVRLGVVLLRCASLSYWIHTGTKYSNLESFRLTNILMIVALCLSSLLSWRVVRIVYLTPSTIQQSAKEGISSIPNSAEKRPRSSYRPAHPQANTFDNMAQAFTSSFQDGAALPPSPTLTASSYTTRNTDATTPFAQRSAFLADDDMDWTPTRRRFASQEPQVLPNQWSQRQQTTQHTNTSTQQAEPHSLFSRPDPNPFRHKVPAAPRAPAQAKADPWKPGIWDPPLKDTTPNFFRREQQSQTSAGDGVGETKGLDGFGVPRNVKRDAELFASPKLKYDNYGTMKDTGLEDTFNELFSK
ncbi:hypothetical protein ACN47E_004714 [Coniothyrium glycines]